MIVEIKGNKAMFCDPVFKTERRSYPVPTPSALAGTLRSIYKKPEMYYVIDRIHVMNRPVLRTEFRRYVDGTSATSHEGVSVPRSETSILNPHYFVEFHLCLTGTGDPDRDSLGKHCAILERRLLNGQYFSPPYLGTKECACDVSLVADASDVPESEMKGEYPLPVMVYDVPIDPDTRLPGKEVVLYHPRCVDGVIDCAKGLERSESGGGFLLCLERFYRRFGEERGMPRMGYEEVSVPWKLLLSPEGEPVRFGPSAVREIDVRGGEPGEKTVRLLSERMTVPAAPLKSGLKLASAFGWGAPDYVLGLDADEARGREKRRIFLERLRSVGGSCESLAPVISFCETLETPEGRERVLSLVEPYADSGKDFITVTGSIVFEVAGRGPVLSEPDVLAAWDAQVALESEEGRRGQCFVTGEKDAILADSHPRVKGVNGAGSLCRLISIDKNTPSLFSYGHEGLDNAPVGRSVSFRAHTNLNWLLANQSVHTGRGTLIYWSEDGLPLLDQKLAALFDGSIPDPEGEVPDGAVYYLAELRGNGAGRVLLSRFEAFAYGDGRLTPFLTGLKNVAYDPLKLDNWKGEETVDTNNAAYLIGELFAKVRIAQLDAVPSTRENGGIEPKMMNLVGSRPALGASRLMRMARIYLSKKDYGMGEKISDTLDRLKGLDNPYPASFTPTERCIFQHSYHANMQRLMEERGARIEAAVANKKAKERNSETEDKNDENE